MYSNLSKVNNAFRDARHAFDECQESGNQGGAARVYIQLIKMPRKNSKAYREIENYFDIFNRPYNSRAIYCGYDNFDGRAWFKAHAAAKVLNEYGFECYVDADMD